VLFEEEKNNAARQNADSFAQIPVSTVVKLTPADNRFYWDFPWSMENIRWVKQLNELAVADLQELILQILSLVTNPYPTTSR
jgi:hypothetical protein